MAKGDSGLAWGSVVLLLFLAASVASIFLVAWAPLLPYFKPALAPLAMALPPAGLFFAIGLLAILVALARSGGAVEDEREPRL